MNVQDGNVQNFLIDCPQEVPEKYLDAWRKGMDIAKNANLSTNDTLSDSDTSGAGV